MGIKGLNAWIHATFPGVMLAVDEQGGAAWLWSEALALAWKRVFKSPIEPGRFYPMCVNTETLAEMALIGLPLGVYGICLGIDSHSVKKNK